jgi:cation transport ATPase
MQVNNSATPQAVDLRVLGLHCAEEVGALRRALDRQTGVSDVHIDQLRARVSFTMAAPATLPAVSAAVTRAGLRLVQPDEAVPELAVEPRVWWSGVTSAACLVTAVIAQFVESGGAWLSLVAEVEADGPSWVSTTAYAAAALAASAIILPKAFTSARAGRLDMHVLVVVAIAGAAWLGRRAHAGQRGPCLLLYRWPRPRRRGRLHRAWHGAPREARRTDSGRCGRGVGLIECRRVVGDG